MTAKEFDEILESRISKTRRVLASKAGEYATDKDRLHNFKDSVGGLTLGETPAQVCWGYMRKHLQSLYDMVHGGLTYPPEVIDEKIGDAINYTILLEGILREGR